MLEYLAIMRYFGNHPEKGGYWYSFRNMFIVLFTFMLIATIVGFFGGMINFEGIGGLIIFGIIIFLFNTQVKRKVRNYKENIR